MHLSGTKGPMAWSMAALAAIAMVTMAAAAPHNELVDVLSRSKRSATSVRYEVHEDKVPYEEAELVCLILGGEITSAKNEAEWKALFRAINNYRATKQGFYWISLMRTSPDTFGWQDGESM